MYILGISCFYHDSSAALLKDGRIVAAAEEERFTRRKHDSSFPAGAIDYCLSSQNISIDDIGYIGFYEKPILKLERALYQAIDTFPKSFGSFVSAMPAWMSEKLRIIKIIRKKLKYKKNVLFIEHHLAHAAASFLVSPFDRAAILTIDGVGEWSTTTLGFGEKTDIDLFKEIKFPHSIGLLYSTITAYLGFSVNNSEYKVMGLSAYGETDKTKNLYYDKLKQTIDIKDDGSFRLDMSYFCYHYGNKMPSKKFCDLLGGPISMRGEEKTQRHKDIAAALQLITEEVIFKILNYLFALTKCDNLVLAGGVALNSVINGKILRKTPFKNLWIQPNASDGGTSVGAASYIYNSILKNERNYIMENAFLGPEYSREEIKSFLDENKLAYSEYRNENDLLDRAAALLDDNKIIGWFQGRMEWGPRALGHRSILASPLHPRMKDMLNQKVKHREMFRPFAPSVCEDDATKYFDIREPLPDPARFMLMVFPVKKEYREKIPAVTHIDGSGRMQAVRRVQNVLFYDLIKKFGRLSGIPVLINTSFNVNNEPIVCHPCEAIKCFNNTEIDHLVIDNLIISKK